MSLFGESKKELREHVLTLQRTVYAQHDELNVQEKRAEVAERNVADYRRQIKELDELTDSLQASINILGPENQARKEDTMMMQAKINSLASELDKSKAMVVALNYKVSNLLTENTIIYAQKAELEVKVKDLMAANQMLLEHAEACENMRASIPPLS